ncbi:hypothetical protein BBJ28_00022107 [Nothophytophthora sp. Chile5]|nr:hypothetical protein BBJ28_00022107 [Nothophytophthora sp. Chile5]
MPGIRTRPAETQAPAQEETCKLMDEIREFALVEAAAAKPSPELGRGRNAIPTRSASAGVHRGRKSSIASSSSWTLPVAMLRGEATAPRFAKAPTCKGFECAFNLLVRRHHCRRCDLSFCFDHLTRPLALQHLGYTAVQCVCDGCFANHLQAFTVLKMPPLLNYSTDELSTSSFASLLRRLEGNNNFFVIDSPDPTTTCVSPLPLRV